MANTWVIDRQKVKPNVGAISANRYDVVGQPSWEIAAQLMLRLWKV